jgi:hypothetical protein
MSSQRTFGFVSGSSYKQRWASVAIRLVYAFALIVLPLSSHFLPEANGTVAETYPWPVGSDTADGASSACIHLGSRFVIDTILPSATFSQTEISVAIDPADRNDLLVGANTLLVGSTGEFTQGGWPE